MTLSCVPYILEELVSGLESKSYGYNIWHDEDLIRFW